GLLQEGEAALAREDWPAAAVPLARARDRLRAEPDLADLHRRVAGLTARADRQRGDRERLRLFHDRRNQALLNASLFTGSDRDAALGETAAAAREALAVFGVTP